MDSTHLLQLGLVYLVALVLSIAVHEFGHAFVADRLGDRLPRAQGRVTLNPLAHIDPMGTLLLPLLAFVLSAHHPAVGSRILGWGRPVQTALSTRDLRGRLSLRTANALVAIAGPAMNILFALLLSVVFAALLRAGQLPLADGVAQVIRLNLGLCIFNLLPLPPLDGGAVLARLLPPSLSEVSAGLERYGGILLFALLMTGVLSVILLPAYMLADLWLAKVVEWAAR